MGAMFGTEGSVLFRDGATVELASPDSAALPTLLILPVVKTDKGGK
jgi:hypothetical protein